MNTGDGKISSIHLMFAMVSIIQGMALLTAFLFGVTKQDTWMVVVSGYLIALLIILLYAALTERFPGKTLVEILRAVYGEGAGSVLSSIYSLYFISLAVLGSNDASNFVTGRLMPETPKVVVVAVLLFVGAWAVRKGAEKLLRISVMLSLSSIVVLITDVILTAKEYRFDRFFPMLTLPPIRYIQGTQVSAMIPFTITIVLLMISPTVRNQKEIKKAMILGLSIGAGTILTIVLRDIAVLGNMVSYAAMPTYESLRLINVGDILTRMEVLYAVTLLLLMSYQLFLIYYAAVRAIAQTTKLKCERPLVPVIGSVIAVFPLFLFDSSAANVEWAVSVASFYHGIFQVVIPLVTWLVAMIRFPKSQEQKQPQPQPPQQKPEPEH